ncbi:hypothetical protein [Chitinophaga sp.]|uniref:hypothetical protein n=1 Tax=Chitinophaga sp. TaxID=1869181 RepID=UPI0031D043D6
MIKDFANESASKTDVKYLLGRDYEFYVVVDDNGSTACKKAIMELKKMATDITLQVLQVLPHRADDHSFHILFSTKKATDPDSINTTCQKNWMLM